MSDDEFLDTSKNELPHPHPISQWRRLQLLLGFGPPMTGDEWLRTEEGRTIAAEAFKLVKEKMAQGDFAKPYWLDWLPQLEAERRRLEQVLKGEP